MEGLPISVIVPTKNVEVTLEECLSSVQGNNPAEIIIIDGVSSDRTIEIARRYTEKIYSDEGKGPSYAHQLGAEMATQEYIAYVDADIVLPEGILTTLLTELKDSDCVSMPARVLPVSVATYWERATDWNAGLLRARRGVGGLQATVLRKDIVLQYGFDTSIRPAGDDLDFIIRVQRGGHKLGNSSAFVYHHHRANLRSFYKARYSYSRGISRLMRKYGPWHARFWPPLITVYWLILCLIKGKPNYIPYFIVNGIAQTAGMVKGFLELLEKAVRKEAKGAGR